MAAEAPEISEVTKRTVPISGALAAVSPEIGRSLFYEVTCHDDGVAAMGGISAALVALPGGGKSTLLMQLAQLVNHVNGHAAKLDVINLKNQHVPETVIWRGLEYDHWACFIQEYWMRSFPKHANPKPIRLHMHHRDRLTFYLDFEKKPYQLMLSGDDIKFYNGPDELYANLLPGGINVVYEPQEYYLTSKTLQRIMASRLKATKYEDQEDIRAPSFMWWYEFIETLSRIKKRGEYYTLIIDEAARLFPFGAQGDHWHMIGWLVETLIHLRKKNISTFFAIHGLDLIDPRVAKRIQYFIWLPGSLPGTRNNMVTATLVGRLPLGWGIIEQPRRRFGRFRFGRIPRQPPVVQAVGLSGI